MKIQIKNRFDASVIFECEADSVKRAVELAVKSKIDLSWANLSRANLSRANLYEANLYGANLSRANLYEANLSRANLYEADLSRANLYGANLSGANLSGANLSRADIYGANLYEEQLDKIPIQIINLTYFVMITKQHIEIGCELHKAEEWFNFDDNSIAKMDDNALAWWKVYKPIIKSLWEEHCK